MEQNRLVRKYFKCSNCKLFDAKLINPSITKFKCHTCQSYLKEISESEFKKLKQNVKDRQQRQNANRNNPNQNNEERQRGNSSLHYSRINMNTENENNRQQNNNNRNNINTDFNFYHNQGNNNNINNNNHNNNNRQRRDNHHHHHTNNRRRRDRSSERRHHHNVFEDFFGNFVSPLQNMVHPLFGNNGNRNPFRIVVQRQNVPHDIFDPTFSLFGSMFNGLFQDNFSSNFRSNYRGNFTNEILNTIQRNQAESRRQAHPPTSDDNLKKLKKFSLTEKYCKKEKDGKLELPSCCICLDEIVIGAKTVLLPCGHMFHSDCIITWLKKNNTCPMCRFEIK